MNGVNELTNKIIGAAIEVHRTLGPGLLESTYEGCLLHELAERELYAERQKALPVVYKGFHIGLLINFSVKQLTMGIRRLVHELPE